MMLTKLCRLPPEERQLSTSLNPMCEVFPKGRCSYSTMWNGWEVFEACESTCKSLFLCGQHLLKCLKTNQFKNLAFSLIRQGSHSYLVETQEDAEYERHVLDSCCPADPVVLVIPSTFLNCETSSHSGHVWSNPMPAFKGASHQLHLLAGIVASSSLECRLYALQGTFLCDINSSSIFVFFH